MINLDNYENPLLNTSDIKKKNFKGFYKNYSVELHIVFVDKEKAYNRVLMAEFLDCARQLGVAEKYVKMVYNNILYIIMLSAIMIIMIIIYNDRGRYNTHSLLYLLTFLLC